MISRIVTLTFKPENVASFLATFNEYKYQIKAMNGCIHLDLLQDLEEANTFSTYSIWESELHLNNYRQSELFGKIWPKTKSLFSARPKAKSYYLKQSTGYPQKA